MSTRWPWTDLPETNSVSLPLPAIRHSHFRRRPSCARAPWHASGRRLAHTARRAAGSGTGAGRVPLGVTGPCPAREEPHGGRYAPRRGAPVFGCSARSAPSRFAPRARLCAGRVRADSYPHTRGGTAVAASGRAARRGLGAPARQRAPAAPAAARPGTAAPTGRARGWHRARWRKSQPAAGQRLPLSRPRRLLGSPLI